MKRTFIHCIGVGLACWLMLAPTQTTYARHPVLIQLKGYDADGNVVIIGKGSTVPYSPKQTCGTCHDYEAITRGFHFQQGWDEVSDTYGSEHGMLPFDISPGQAGKWTPPSYRRLPKKRNGRVEEIDFPLYAYARSCSTCHPGGGATEFDRDGNRMDNPDTWKPPTSMDGDYFGNNWLESGVLEADCLICHLEGYDIFARNSQIQKGNFRAAPSVGAFGTAASNTEISYRPGMVNTIGMTSLENLKGSPGADNCNFCHAGTPQHLFAAPGFIRADIARRGRTWDDPKNPDVHNQAGLTCVDCHGAFDDVAKGSAPINHQFSKGHIIAGTVRDDLDNTMQKCGDCHAADNDAGAPEPDHGELSGHLDYIDCSTCHIPQKRFLAIRMKDLSIGRNKAYFVGGTPKNPYLGFRPTYAWWESKRGGRMKIYPMNFMVAAFWNDGNRPFHPVSIGKIKQAAQAAGLSDDIGNDGFPEINTPEEIDAVRTRLVDLGVHDPKLFYSTEVFMMSHNIAPAEQALGANGCGDCHSPGSYFFEGEVTNYNFPVGPSDHFVSLLEIRDKNGRKEKLHMPPKMPMWQFLGYTEARKTALEQARKVEPPATTTLSYDDTMGLDQIAEHIKAIETSINKIKELSKKNVPNYDQLVRWISSKKTHASEIQNIISEYFMTQRVKPDAKKYVEKMNSLYNILVYAVKCKKTTDLANTEKLKALLKEFEKL